MIRYDMYQYHVEDGGGASMDREADGEYVLYSDAIAAIEAAYREGFQDGESHQAVYWKYPGEDESWTTSEAKRKAESSDE